uniref:GENE53 n=1 Tax=Leishmania braziliensis TaxID=5660 RepID=O00837_LEIBR|nr:GENE53 [Leishmania braziliensis]
MAMTGKTLVAAEESPEDDLVAAVRRIAGRIDVANPLTPPWRESRARMEDESPLGLAAKANTLLRAECIWSERGGLVSCPLQRLAKLTVVLRNPGLSIRPFASILPLTLLHAAHHHHHHSFLNPAWAFSLARACRGKPRSVHGELGWDGPLLCLDATAHLELPMLDAQLVRRTWAGMAYNRTSSYQ